MRPHVPEDLPRQAMQQLDVAILWPHTANQMAHPVHQRFLLFPEQITNCLERFTQMPEKLILRFKSRWNRSGTRGAGNPSQTHFVAAYRDSLS
jgi:hypothetical protein